MEYKEAMRILGLKDGFSETDEKKAYKNMAMRCHPDQGGTDGLFSIVNEAHNILSKSTAATQEPEREEPQPHPKREPWKPSWSDLPWDQIFLTESEYIKLVLGGETIEKLWIWDKPFQTHQINHYMLKIKPSDLATTPLRTRVRLKGGFLRWDWNHLFAPKIDIGDAVITNSEYDTTKFCVRIRCLSPGVHRICLKILGASKVFWFFCGKKSKTIRKTFEIYGVKTVYVQVTLTTDE